MTVTRPAYAAHIEGSPDVPVSIRDDSGEITFDSTRAPHVRGDVTLAVEDAALLDDLDPRDGRRLIISAYPTSHLEPVYSAWVEQRRNLPANPIPVTTSGYSGPGAAAVTADGFTITNTSTTTPYIFSSASIAGVTAGRVYAFRAKIKVYAAPGSVFTNVVVRPHKNTGNVYYPITPAIRVPADATEHEVAFYWTAPATVPAGEAFNLSIVGNGTGLVGSKYSMRQVLIEDVGTVVPDVPPAEFFTPGETAAERRTRWLGAANASASVVETRALTGFEQVPDGAPRIFDLGIRSANPDRSAATVACRLASDEALLGDHRPLAGMDLIQYANDIHALVEAVIALALGAPVDVAGGSGSVYPLWAVTNLIPNPSGEGGVAGWSTSTGASNLTSIAPPIAPVLGVRAVRWRANAGTSVVQAGGWDGVNATKVAQVTPGRLYTASLYLLSSTARAATIRLAFRDENGTSLPNAVFSSAPVMTSSTGWTRLSVTGIPPKLAQYAYIIVSTEANTEGQLHYGDGVMLTEGPFLPEVFDGSSSNPDYTYEWTAASHASPSTRTPTRDAPDRDALYWRAGISALEFLAPLVQVLGLRLVCDETREWTLRDETYRAAGAQTFRNAVNIAEASEELSRDSDDWFQGAVFRYTWTDRDGIDQSRDDTYVLAGVDQPKVILREISAPYPGPGRAEYAVRRAQGRGRTVTASRQAKWDENAEQPLTALLEGTEIQTGLADRVVFDLAENTVTTTGRTTDTPANAIALLTGTINALTGTINDL